MDRGEHRFTNLCRHEWERRQNVFEIARGQSVQPGYTGLQLGVGVRLFRVSTLEKFADERTDTGERGICRVDKWNVQS